MNQSFIGIEYENGLVEFIYCRDGDFDTLCDSYTDVEKIQELISNGDLSKLKKKHKSHIGYSFI